MDTERKETITGSDADTTQYVVGPETMHRVFRMSGMHNLSDMQRVLDRIEAVLSYLTSELQEKRTNKVCSVLLQDAGFPSITYANISSVKIENDFVILLDGSNNKKAIFYKPSSVEITEKEVKPE